MSTERSICFGKDQRQDFSELEEINVQINVMGPNEGDFDAVHTEHYILAIGIQPLCQG